MKPLILRAHIYTPGGKGRHSMAAAVAHSKYMRSPKKEELVHQDEALRDRGLDEVQIHARYMADRPGSEGLFGPSGAVLDGPAIDAELARHTGPVWRLIVSVHEDDVRSMGGALLRRPAWEDAARAVLPRMAQEMGIPADSLRWSAAMHRKQGHPHVHVLVWSADPSKGFLSKQGLAAARRAWAHELYGPERDRLGKEKSALRQEITATSRLLLARTDAAELGAQLAAISQTLPGHGRLAYAFMPGDVKAKLDATADWLLRRPELAAQAKRYGDIAAELATHYSTDPARHAEAREKALQDIRQRMASGVLKAAVGFDERLAWRQVSDAVYRTARVGRAAQAQQTPVAVEETDILGAIQPHVKAAVSRLARNLASEAAHQEARALLALPDVAPLVAPVLDRAERRAHITGRTVASTFVAARGSDDPLSGLRDLVRREQAAEQAATERAAASVATAGAPSWARESAALEGAPDWWRRYVETVTWTEQTVGAWQKHLPEVLDRGTSLDAHRVLGGIMRSVIGDDLSYNRVDAWVRRLAEMYVHGVDVVETAAPTANITLDLAGMFAKIEAAMDDARRNVALDEAATWAAQTLRDAKFLPPSPPPPPGPPPEWAAKVAAYPSTPDWFRAYIESAPWDAQTVGAWRRHLPRTRDNAEAQDAHRILGGIVRGTIADEAPFYDEVDAYIRQLAMSHPEFSTGNQTPKVLDEATARLRAAIEREMGPLRAAAVAEARQRALTRLETRIARTLERSAEYVRDARAYQASHIAGGLARAMYQTLRQAERDALLAAAREAEEEAERKRQAAAQATRAI